jgi:hypothetical protein
VTAWTLRFGTPEHGWLDVELTGPSGTSHLDASDVPADSLCKLACAALSMLEQREEARVKWFLEPAEVVWVFRRAGDERAADDEAHEVLVFALNDRKERQPIGAGSPEEIALAIWRGFRRLEADAAWSSHATMQERLWSHGFPTKEVAALGEKLGRR